MSSTNGSLYRLPAMPAVETTRPARANRHPSLDDRRSKRTVRVAENRTTLAEVPSRIDLRKRSWPKGERQIDKQRIDRFGKMMRGKMRG